jgi:hypothetical protein
MIAPFVLDGPINRLAFETYVERVLTPELRRRRRRDGQSVQPQGAESAREDRSGRRKPFLPSALQPGLQSD